jgi:hypothetical protein
VAPYFPWFLSFRNRTQNSWAAGASPTTSPSGDLIPTIRGSEAHPGRGNGSFLFLKEQLKDIIIIIHARKGISDWDHARLFVFQLFCLF